MTHEERVAIARGLADAILRTYGDAVLAVYITSSTAKGLDREHSDLELTAVVRDGVEIEEKSYIYRGILVEIDYIQATKLLGDARRVTRRWPIEADEYRSRLVLFERDGWLRHLEEAVQENDAADIRDPLRMATTNLIETRDKVRNAHLASDEFNVHVESMWVAENAALMVLFLNRRYMLTTSRFFSQTFECPAQPRDFRRRIERLVGVFPTNIDDLVETVEALTDELLTMVRARGISIESDVLQV